MDNSKDKNNADREYNPLDIEKLRKLGHKGAYMGNCSSGAFYAVIKEYSQRTGKSFDGLTIEPPHNMMNFGGGGIVGRRMCCGALLGASAAVNLIADSKTARDIITRLFKWYARAEFPSDLSNEYAKNGQFEDQHCPENLPQSTAGSALCADSLRQWIKKSGHAYRTPQRLERCHRLTGDVVAKTGELLNEKLG